MLIRSILVVGVAILNSCTSARMAIDPELRTGFQELEIMGKPGFLSGSELKFGQYSATKVNYRWARSRSFLAERLFFNDEEDRLEPQGYTFEFTGKRKWIAECATNRRDRTLQRPGRAELDCAFVSFPEEGSLRSKFEFNFRGPNWLEATGTFRSGKRDIRVVATDRIEGHHSRSEVPTGYYFYLGNDVVAAVDDISGGGHGGPVWLRNDLAPETKDRLALAIVALLLIREK